MTRKDYKALAAVVAQVPDMDTRLFLADRIGAVLKADNARFDWARWMDACDSRTARKPGAWVAGVPFSGQALQAAEKNM